MDGCICTWMYGVLSKCVIPLPVANLRPLCVLMTVQSISKPATLVDPGRESESSTIRGRGPLVRLGPASDHLRSHPSSVSPRAFLAAIAVASTALRLGRGIGSLCL